MESNLTQASSGDAVQRALALQAGKHSLNGRSLPVQGFPLRCLHPLTKLSYKGVVTGKYVDDWLGSILPTNQLYQGLTRVTFVGHYVLWAEGAVSKTGLGQDIRGPSSVMDVARTDVSSDARFNSIRT